MDKCEMKVISYATCAACHSYFKREKENPEDFADVKYDLFCEGCRSLSGDDHYMRQDKIGLRL